MAVVYTAIFGDIRDFLFSPQNLKPTTRRDAYLDVDRPGATNGWATKPPAWEHATNPRLRARRHKILSHQLYPDEDLTLWVDGCLTPLADPEYLAAKYLQDVDICLFRHMERNCVYQELEACIKLRKDDPEVMRNQVLGYRDAGYPYNNGLAETTAVLRRHTPEIRELNERWWSEVRNKSLRDQLSLDYLCWSMNIRYSVFAGQRTQSPHFQWRPHR